MEFYKIKYPDGSFYTEIENFKKELTFRINNYDDLWQLNQIIDIYKHNKIRPTITIPCLFTAQEDRRFAENYSSGLKLVCNFLNSMEADFRIFHPHNSEVVEALLNDIKIIDNYDFIKEVLLNLYTDYAKNNLLKTEHDLILFSSDAGGFKPLIKLSDKLEWKGEVYGASKSRKYENDKSKLVQIIDRKDFEGKDILIIDDILVGGNTFKGLSKMLRERNCGKLYLAISHATIKNLGNDPVTNYFDAVFTTNSKGFEYFTEKNDHDKISVIKPDNLEIINLFS